VSNLDVVSLEDLRRLLREIGYSSKAVEEILKWYKQSNAQND